MPAFVSACPPSRVEVRASALSVSPTGDKSRPPRHSPGLAPASGPGAAKETAAAFSAKAAAASGSPQGYYGRVTGPLALMTWCHATGGADWEHWPLLLRAPMPRMLSW